VQWRAPIARLVAISSGAGVVAGWTAITIGFLSGTLIWLNMNMIRTRIIFFPLIEDHVGVFHTRCVAALAGGFCTGVFAIIEGCTTFGFNNTGGAINGNGRQVWKE
jgi:Amt family ammonium transporter